MDALTKTTVSIPVPKIPDTPDTKSDENLLVLDENEIGKLLRIEKSPGACGRVLPEEVIESISAAKIKGTNLYGKKKVLQLLGIS